MKVPLLDYECFGLFVTDQIAEVAVALCDVTAADVAVLVVYWVVGGTMKP